MRKLLLHKEAVKQFGCRVLKRRDLVCCCLVSAYELRLVFARLSLFRPNILTVEVRLAIESTHDMTVYSIEESRDDRDQVVNHGMSRILIDPININYTCLHALRLTP